METKIEQDISENVYRFKLAVKGGYSDSYTVVLLPFFENDGRSQRCLNCNHPAPFQCFHGTPEDPVDHTEATRAIRCLPCLRSWLVLNFSRPKNPKPLLELINMSEDEFAEKWR